MVSCYNLQVSAIASAVMYALANCVRGQGRVHVAVSLADMNKGSGAKPQDGSIARWKTRYFGNFCTSLFFIPA